MTSVIRRLGAIALTLCLTPCAAWAADEGSRFGNQLQIRAGYSALTEQRGGEAESRSPS